MCANHFSRGRRGLRPRPLRPGPEFAHEREHPRQLYGGMELTIHIDLPERLVANTRTRAVAAAFEMDRPAGAATRRLLAPTRLGLSPGQLAYLVGASGSGKSLLLAALARAWPGPVVAVRLGGPDAAGRSRSAVLDQLGLPVESSLRLLCSAGLGEARLWLMPAGCLSAGQADRLALARLYARVEAMLRDGGLQNGGGNEVAVLLLIDEFASRLDRLTARVLSANLRRWLDRTPGAAAVVATAHDDLADPLRPDRIWVKTNEGGLVVEKWRMTNGEWRMANE